MYGANTKIVQLIRKFSKMFYSDICTKVMTHKNLPVGQIKTSIVNELKIIQQTYEKEIE